MCYQGNTTHQAQKSANSSNTMQRNLYRAKIMHMYSDGHGYGVVVE